MLLRRSNATMPAFASQHTRIIRVFPIRGNTGGGFRRDNRIARVELLRAIDAGYTEPEAMNTTRIRMSVKRRIAMAKYLTLIEDMDAHVARAWKHPDHRGCPATCNDCCHAAAVLPVGVVEMEHVLNGLIALPTDVREFILEKARRSVALLDAYGLDVTTIVSDPMGKPSDLLAGKPEAPCPLLIGGVCSVYDHRPLICRVWGAPIFTGKSIECCPKTFASKTIETHEAVPYLDYWRKARTLSASLEKEDKEPMAHLLLRKWKERVERVE